ncbi:MAG: flavodoxin [Lachnospiraceae bacterium]|nr:flavodoxin [Lachnospiraceae bacterium]
MRDLIVYYSLEGNTEYAVNRIKEKTGADTLKLVPKKAYVDKGFAKYVWGGKSAVMAEKPALNDYEVDLTLYDRIIFGFPVWASTFTPPIRTFISDNMDALKGKKFAAFACQSGNGAEKAFEKLAAYIGIDSFDTTAVFIDPKARPDGKKDVEIDSFAEKLV